MNAHHTSRQTPVDIGRVQRLRRVFLAILILLVIAGLLFVGSAYESAAIRRAIRLAGGVLITVGIAGRIWSTFYIGGRKSMVLIDKGPYSITRNPLYVFSAIAAAGVGALSASLVVAALFAVGTWLVFHIVILQEEAYLSTVLGQPYLDYKSRVPRFLPRFSLFEDVREVAVETRRVYVTLADGLVFYLAVPFFILADNLQDAGILPVLLRLP